jgi:hypothetical protein
MSITSAARAFALLAICAVLVVSHAGAPPVKAEKAEKAKAPPRLITEKQIVEELDRVIDVDMIDDPKATLRELLTHYSDKYKMLAGVRVVYNNAAFALDEPSDVANCLVGKVEAARMTVGQLLRTLLSRVPSSSPATFLVRRGYIEITPAAAARVELGLPAIAPKKGEVVEYLPPLVFYLETENDSFADICAKIAERCELNVLIDPRVKMKGDAIIKATLHNVPAPAALELLADMAELAVVRKGNIFYVTTPENAKKLPRAEK